MTDEPLHRVTASAAMPFETLAEVRASRTLPLETLRGVSAQASMPYETLGLAGAGTAMLGVGVYLIARSGSPEPGYHAEHHHGDVVAGAIMFGLGGAALYSVGRAAVETWRARRRARTFTL